MAVNRDRCPECQGRMVQGFLPEYIRNRVRGTYWLEGELKSSVWSGSEFEERDLRAVNAWRCSDCGAVRLYADEKISPPGFLD